MDRWAHRKTCIVPENRSAYENEDVSFTCNADGLDDSNSRCRKFIWTKVHDRTFRKVDHSNQLEFVMAEQNEGKYQCQCENDYGSSEVSEPVELTFLNSSSASTFLYGFNFSVCIRFLFWVIEPVINKYYSH